MKNTIVKTKSMLAGFALTLLVTLSQSTPPAHAAATSYQLPTSPYSVGGYDFGQYVSGSGYHLGQDVAAPAGRAVYATAEGTVAYSARTPDSYRWGNLIMVEHSNPDGTKAVSLYGHLSNDRRVTAGQVVQKGQLLGFVGPAYTAENGNWGAHLHFQFKYGPYGAPAGTYAAGMNGYTPSAGTIASYAHPTGYINGRNAMGGGTPQPPAQVWDYQPYAILNSGQSHGQYEQWEAIIQIKNTGNQTWSKGGANPVRLGTIHPTDRGSAFSAGMGGQGWLYPNRIDMEVDTPPGNVATFRFRMNDQLVPPGNYAERFAPVVEGRGWMGDKNLGVAATVRPAQYAAQYAGQSYHAASSPTDRTNPVSGDYLTPDGKVNSKAYIKNVGDIPWEKTGPNPVRLGTTRPNDRGSGFRVQNDGSIPGSENWLAYNRPSEIDGRLEANGTITPVDRVNPGETAVFSFTMKGVPQSGTFPEYFNPVVEGKGWMNDLGMWDRLRVLPPGYHYEYAGQDNPDAVALARGETAAYVDIRNSGQTPWSVGGNVRLGTDRVRDRGSAFRASDWIAPNRLSAIDGNVSVPGKSTIAPGEVGRFNFNVTNPTQPDGQYPEWVQPVVDGQGWMPENVGVWLPVNVQSAPRDHQVVSQRFDRDINSLHTGDLATATLAIRNLGNRPWKTDGDGAVSLATSRPNDRGSGFSTLTGENPWLSSNRASKIDGRVTTLTPLTTEPASQINQGEVGLFKLDLRVPSLSAGLFPEYFNLVQDGAGGGWFPDYGIYFPLRISP